MIDSPPIQAAQMTSAITETPVANQKLVRGLGLLDSTMLVAGSMIGSGIFIVSSIIARQVGSPGWLLVVWIVTGLLTLTAALSYGELAAMMPKAGGQYVYLREAFSPLWGFLYGWTLFLVIQTGTIAAVAVGFARYMGVLVPWVSESNYLIAPIRFGGYAVSLSTAQFVGLALIGFLTYTNTRGLEVGKLIQNVFTTAKTGALIGLIVLGIIVGLRSGAGAENFQHFWTLRGNLQDVGAGLTAATVFGLFVGICVAQTNSLFSADAWNNITFTAGEVVNPRRNVPLSLAFGHSRHLGRRARPAAHGQDRRHRCRERLRQPVRQSARLCHFGRAHFLHPDDHRHLFAASKTARRGTTLPGIRLSNRARSIRRRRDRHSCGPVRISDGDHLAGVDYRAEWCARVFSVEISE